METLIKQGSNEWLHWRRKKICGSDAPIIMKISPFTTPYELWEQKIHGTEISVNPAMKRGNDLEKSALECFEDKKNVFLKYQVCLENPKRKWQAATLDGYDSDSKILVEIKCTSKKNHEIAKSGKIPDYYFPQLQHQLDVTGLDGMFYFSFDGVDGVIVEVPRDQKYIDNLVIEEEKFLQKLLQIDPPELSDKDWIDMDTNEQWRQLSKEWLDVQSNLKSYESREDEIRKKLIDLSEEKNAKGAGIRLCKSISKGAVDYVRIPQLKDINLEPYRKKSFTKWRLSAIS